ncbi:hypothetical protein HGRIS_000347 [Hohenbuehelia grisea]|uniref:Mob1/phocein n=1 Tax=Hohenbuehelia grisea TaxID=104357 RepID=A0ABR3JQX1_9AGAR
MSVIIQRPLRGSRISSFYPVKTLPSLSSLDSAFQLQEYISLLIRLDVHDVDSIVSIPGKNTKAEGTETKEKREGETTEIVEEKEADKDRKSEVSVDEACWIYEQLRRLAQDLTHPLITMLQQECTRASCPEMKAGEWLYLCVAHGNDGAMEQCCAIDYILHTLDSATALLNSPRTFPSRLQIPPTSHRHFSSLARRLGRIFAHAYFHHREAFEQAEAESSLYARFLALTSKFDLVPSEFLVIPPRFDQHEGEGEGDAGEANEPGRGRGPRDVQPPRLLAASVQPQHPREIQSQGEGPSQSLEQQPSGPPGLSASEGSSGWVDANSANASASSSGSESPRKFGRSRTDTMVFSEATNVAEELAKTSDRAGEQEPRNDNILAGGQFSILKRDVSVPTELEPAASELREKASELPVQADDKPGDDDKAPEDISSTAESASETQETASPPAAENSAATTPASSQDNAQPPHDSDSPEDIIASSSPPSPPAEDPSAEPFPEVIVQDFSAAPGDDQSAVLADAGHGKDAAVDVPVDVSEVTEAESPAQVEPSVEDPVESPPREVTEPLIAERVIEPPPRVEEEKASEEETVETPATEQEEKDTKESELATPASEPAPTAASESDAKDEEPKSDAAAPAEGTTAVEEPQPSKSGPADAPVAAPSPPSTTQENEKPKEPEQSVEDQLAVPSDGPYAKEPTPAETPAEKDGDSKEEKKLDEPVDAGAAASS